MRLFTGFIMDRRAAWCLLRMFLSLASAGAQNEWTYLGGPAPPNPVYDIALGHQGTTPIMYVAQGAALLKSTDQGESWITLPTMLWNVACEENNPDVVFGISGIASPGSTSAEVQKSLDGGNSWTTVLASLDSTFPWRLAVSPLNPHIICAGFSSGAGVNALYFSKDGGRSWNNATHFGFPSGVIVSDLAFDPSDSGCIYASVSSGDLNQVGVWRTTTGGNDWHPVGPARAQVYSLGLGRSGPLTLYAGVTEGVFESTDRGDHWNPTGFSYGGLYVSALQVDPVSPQVLYAGTYTTGWVERIGVYKSTDAGATWFRSNSGVTDNWIKTLKLDPQNHLALFAGTTAGFFRSTDAGLSWVLKSEATSPVALASMSAVGDTLIASGERGEGGLFYRSTNRGATWAMTKAFDGNYWAQPGPTIVSLGTNPGLVFAARSLHTLLPLHILYRSTDCGGTWELLTQSSLGGVSEGLLLDPNLPSAVYDLSGGGLRRSTDAGEHWVDLYSSTYPYGGFAVDSRTGSNGRLSQTLYLGAAINTLLKSTDAGAGWSDITFAAGAVRALAVDPANSMIVYAGMQDGVLYKSTDAGQSWSPLDDVSAPRIIRQLMVDDESPDNLYCLSGYAGLTTFVHRSTNAGVTWSNISPPSSSWVSFLAMGHLSDTTVVFAASRGVYRYLPDANPTHVLSGGHDPSRFSMAQNYPNPFNPMTTITYALAGGSHVRLRVYDILGREVVTLVDRFEEAGSHRAVFDGTRQSGGVYFCRLQAGSFVDTKKLMLTR